MVLQSPFLVFPAILVATWLDEGRRFVRNYVTWQKKTLKNHYKIKNFYVRPRVYDNSIKNLK